VVRADALRLPLRDASVDLVITSPPYFALRSYRDGDAHYAGQIGSEPTPQVFLEALWAATAEMARVLKPTGSIWVNLGDKYAGSGGHNNSGLNTERYYNGLGIDESRNAPPSYNKNAEMGGATIKPKSLMGLPWRYAIGCIDRLGLILRAEVIWSKPNGLPESVTDRVRRSHEQWFHLVKQGRYFSAVDEVRDEYAPRTVFVQAPSDARCVDGPGTVGRQGEQRTRSKTELNPLGKLPGSVWTIPSEPLIIPPAVQTHYRLPDHFAAFPQEWPRRIILGWSPSGLCVECGEGRRPVVEKGAEIASNGDALLGGDAFTPYGGRPDERRVRTATGYAFPKREATITGYACACTPHTDHPERRRGNFLANGDTASEGRTANSSERNRLYREGVTAGPSITRDYHLEDWTPPPTRPAVVLDPFCGTGTVAMVARALGRVGLSLDLSADYCRLAHWRIHHSGHAAKTEDRTWADQQGALF
jgi:DNA modification methylase